MLAEELGELLQEVSANEGLLKLEQGVFPPGSRRRWRFDHTTVDAQMWKLRGRDPKELLHRPLFLHFLREHLEEAGNPHVAVLIRLFQQLVAWRTLTVAVERHQLLGVLVAAIEDQAATFTVAARDQNAARQSFPGYAPNVESGGKGGGGGGPGDGAVVELTAVMLDKGCYHEDTTHASELNTLDGTSSDSALLHDIAGATSRANVGDGYGGCNTAAIAARWAACVQAMQALTAADPSRQTTTAESDDDGATSSAHPALSDGAEGGYDRNWPPANALAEAETLALETLQTASTTYLRTDQFRHSPCVRFLALLSEPVRVSGQIS